MNCDPYMTLTILPLLTHLKYGTHTVAKAFFKEVGKITLKSNADKALSAVFFKKSIVSESLRNYFVKQQQ
jgi:hypothetical protein